MTAMHPQPNVILVDEAKCIVDPGNIRPQHRISQDRIIQLAASIKQTQQRGGGHHETGVERPICVYRNGSGEFHVPEGQERLLAIRHLRSTDPDYNYIGIPATVHQPPANIWDSTRFQMSHHNADAVDALSLIQRAMELKSSCADGKPATWQMVADVMGGTPSLWSHYQHILALTEALQQAVASGEIRPQNAAIIGRDLPEHDLQTRFHRDLVTEGKSKPRLEGLIQRIRRQVAMEAVIESDDGDVYELPEENEDEEVLAPTPTSGVDREATFLLNQVFKQLTRLEILAGEGRLSGTAGEISKIIERFEDLRNYAD
jgi:ParB-like chromosome segregation protein Spo0J